MKLNRYVVVAAAAVVLAGGGAAGYVAWKQYEASQLPAGIVSVNGRVEATQVDISTKIAGRVIEIVPHEGDIVSTGEVVALIDTSQTMAQLHQAQAAAALARQTVATRLAEVASDDAQLHFANEEMRRTATLVAKGWSTHEQYDQRTQQLNSADAALKAAKSQVDEAEAAVKTADAKVEELQAVIDDSTINRRSAAGCNIASSSRGRCFRRRQDRDGDRSLGRLHDHLPSRSQAGRLKIGDDARVVVDAAPEYVFPATVSFVAPELQFTPKTVEVQSEREQLMFRVKLQAPLQLLKNIEDQVKAGLRGMGYVRIDPSANWPDRLAVKLPPSDEQAGK